MVGDVDTAPTSINPSQPTQRQAGRSFYLPSMSPTTDNDIKPEPNIKLI